MAVTVARLSAARASSTSAITSGTSSSMRNAADLSTTRAPLSRAVPMAPPLLAHLERLLGARADAEDVVQDTLISVYRRLPTLRELLGHLKASGSCRLYACSGSLAAVSDRPDAAEGAVDQVVGWSTVLHLTAGITDRFEL